MRAIVSYAVLGEIKRQRKMVVDIVVNPDDDTYNSYKGRLKNTGKYHNGGPVFAVLPQDAECVTLHEVIE